MSAWLVSEAHIDALVQAAVVDGLVEVRAATATGRMLWRENMLSLAYRYDDPIDEEALDGYRFEGIEAPLDDAVILHLAECYRYQTCEHVGWSGSDAARLTAALTSLIGARHPAWPRDGAGDPIPPGDLPWGIDDIAEAVAVHA